MTTTESRTAADPALMSAVEIALGAARSGGREHVGAHAGVEVDGDRLLTHLFECTDPAYRGWRWGVQVTRASRSKMVTVNDVVLLPGPESLRAPEWLPWSERLLPGDLRPGDLLPAPQDDERLQLVIEDTDADDGFIEMGIGRVRVLSEVGRTEAAERWYAGDNGPDAPIAKQAPAHCVSCGFFVPVVGALGFAFGICANEYAPDDGRVVSVDHGCGAHSEGFPAAVDLTPTPVQDDVVFDDTDVDFASPEDDASSVADVLADETEETEETEETAAFGHS
jgi:hypothetical protein